MPRRRGGKRIETVFWFGFTNSATALASGSAAGIVISLPTNRPTILRVRGELYANMNGTQAPGGRVQVGVGMQLVPAGTLSTVLRTPITDDTSSEWFYYETFVLGYEEMVTDVIDVPQISSFRKTIDNKSMRRTGLDQEVQMVFQNATLGTASTVDVTVVGRILLGIT